VANIYRSALQLLEDLSSGGHNPRDYADLLTEGQDAIGRKGYTDFSGKPDPLAGEYTDFHERKNRMKRFLQVPEGELDYQSMSFTDPKYRLGRAISDYTGSSSGFLNTPFRRRKVEQLANSADYQDPHVKKQVEANALASYLGDNNIKKIAALAKSFYPAPADFITWRGIPHNSTTMKKHYEKPGPSLTTVEEALAAQRTKMDELWNEISSKHGGQYESWPEDVTKLWMAEAQKQNDLTKEYENLAFGGGYQPPPSVENFPLYDDYGSEAFLSTSVDRSSARGFAEDDRGMFRILVPEGTPIRPVFPYSEHEAEMEVLLPPRSLYKRTGERTRQGDVPLVYTGRGRPDSDKYIGAALPIGLGAGATQYEDAEQ
jgi:hypothetical protein